MQEEDLLIISCGMTPIRKLSSISYHSIYLPHGISTESSLDLSYRELVLEPTDQLPSLVWPDSTLVESRVESGHARPIWQW